MPMVFQYGIEYYMNVDIIEEASLRIDGNNFNYSLGIHSKGAFGIGLIFDNFLLSENSELYFYDRENSMYLGSFNASNNKSDRRFLVSIIKSDHIIIELNVPGRRS